MSQKKIRYVRLFIKRLRKKLINLETVLDTKDIMEYPFLRATI